MSNCTCLRRCIQGHLNYHLSSTCITINGIDTLDALELLTNPVNGKSIICFSLWDLLYRIQLESKAPLFLQLSQRSSGEVNAVIPNTADKELMTERKNVQIAAWCQFYWRDINPGTDRFYRKLSDRAFSQVLLHEISKCTWDPSQKSVSSPKAMLEMSAITEFEQQDWVKYLMQGDHSSSTKKKHVKPNMAFPFQDNFSVGTIHGASLPPANSRTSSAASGTIKVADDNDDINGLTSNSLTENGNIPPTEKSRTEPVL
jgi:hypothetical protein